MFLRKLVPPEIVNKAKGNILVRLLYRASLLNPVFSVNCEVTTRCNLMCRMCSRTGWVKKGDFKPQDVLSEVLDRVLECVKDLARTKKRIVFMINGLGEPLLYPHLIDLVRKVKAIDAGIKFSLTTNAVTLTGRMSKDLIEAGVDEMTVSLNTGDRDSYKDLMGCDVYEKVVANILDFLDIRKKAGSKIHGLNIQLMNTKITAASMGKGIKFWKKKTGGQDKIFVHEPVTHAGIIDISGLSDGKALSFRYPCAQCWMRLAVRTNGDVYPCDAAYYSNGPIPELWLGNVLNVPLKDIYFSKDSRIHKIRKRHLNSDYSELPGCLKCDTFKLVPNVFFKLPLTGKKGRWL